MTVAGLGHGAGLARQRRSRRGLCVDRIGLTAPPARCLVGLVYFRHGYACPAQMPGQCCTVRSGAFHPGPVYLPEPESPCQQLAVARCGRRKRPAAQQPADQADHSCDVHILMGVDAKYHLLPRSIVRVLARSRRAGHAGHVSSRSCPGADGSTGPVRAVRTVTVPSGEGPYRDTSRQSGASSAAAGRDRQIFTRALHASCRTGQALPAAARP